MKRRVTYEEMWLEAVGRADTAEDMLREFKRMEDELDPADPAHVAAYEKRLAIARGQANLIAFCERNAGLVKQRIAEEGAAQAAKEAAAAAAALEDTE